MKSNHQGQKYNRSVLAFQKLYLVIITLAFLGLATYVIYSHFHNNTSATSESSNFNLTGSFNCGPAITTAQIRSFIAAYQKGTRGSLLVIDSHGTSAMNFYATCHSLITRNGKIYNSEYSYGDASPIGPLTISTCSLSIKNAVTATADCSDGKATNDTFDLVSQ